ncbi:carbohydrate kinase family protein [Geoalkalibacter sp.]|uniref:carbohydrate kinase family protein n=1 Tax=Geoalkalibacter sp. TaxID=3041440 RepID=UPI00272E51C5|nr:carbohydrate kinase [Geoalkalibacter sp.]
MTRTSPLCIFGEVLFDCFPDGERILGGAPFNVAWHLQALGDAPCFVSAIGCDPLGAQIRQAMKDWGMDAAGVQNDPRHPTGQVQIEMVAGEPRYHIEPDCAYDFIRAEDVPSLPPGAILYHGSLALRQAGSRAACDRLAACAQGGIFLDVNLRPPWWRLEDLHAWLRRARWAKLNREELRQLSPETSNPRHELAAFRRRFGLEQAILTVGREGALVCTADGDIHHQTPPSVEHIVDVVGAGDAFTAAYLQGLQRDWPLSRTLERAQRFAAKVLGLHGATTRERAFYQEFRTD